MTLVLRRIRRVTISLIFIALGVWSWLRLAPPPAATITHTGTPTVSLTYTLTDATGRTVSHHTFLGRPVVYVFGWAKDPDLTPAVLQVLAAALARTQVRDAVAIFITLDPARDDAAILADVVRRSTVPIVALRGPEADIARLTREARLHVRRIDDPVAPGGYRIEHTVAYLVVGRNGQFVGVVPYDTQPSIVAAGIDALIK